MPLGDLSISMNIEKFLHRIGYQGSTTPTLDVLAALQGRFLQTIPFENLDIHNGIKLKFDSRSVFEKIVEKNRGGLCFENNALFYDALTYLGFQVDMLRAEMCSDSPLKKFYSHMTLTVHIDGEDYLVDVGNGRSLGAPLPLSGTSTSQAEGFIYQIRPYDDEHMGLFFRKTDDQSPEWQPRFAFLTTAVNRESFSEACYYVETSEESVFTQSRIATLYTGEGRITLSKNDNGYSLTETSSEKESRVELTPEQFSEQLVQRFGIS